MGVVVSSIKTVDYIPYYKPDKSLKNKGKITCICLTGIKYIPKHEICPGIRSVFNEKMNFVNVFLHLLVLYCSYMHISNCSYISTIYCSSIPCDVLFMYSIVEVLKYSNVQSFNCSSSNVHVFNH